MVLNDGNKMRLIKLNCFEINCNYNNIFKGLILWINEQINFIKYFELIILNVILLQKINVNKLK